MSSKPEVRASLHKASQALKAASVLGKAGLYGDSAGKAYYAMFHAAQALLMDHEISVVKHAAVESMLGQHFAKRGLLDPSYHKMLINARKVRETADYDLYEEIVEPTSGATLANARKFVAEVRRLVRAGSQHRDRGNRSG